MDEELKKIKAIKNSIIDLLIEAFDYCGTSENSETITLNSGKKTNLVIEISIK